MMKKEIRRWLFAAGSLLALATGCQAKQYEKVSIPKYPNTLEQREGTGWEQGKGQPPEIVISEQDSPEIVVEGIPEGEEAEEKEDSLALLFAGDVFLSDHVLNAYEKAGGIQGVLDQGYREVIEEGDFFMANQEFPFSNRGEKVLDKQFTFRLPPERVSLLQEMGIDGVTLANNHALDFGREALLDTCETLDQAGIRHTGAGADLELARKPVIIGQKGKQAAVIGATRVIPSSDWAAGGKSPGMLAAYDMAVLLEEIGKQRQENDFVVVYIHWGIEKEEWPQEYQRRMARQMIDAGADLVVGAHPHVLQGIEYHNGKPIVYSLGNFVFGSSIPRTALLQVDWDGAGEPVLRLIPGTSGAGYTRMLADEADRQEFFSHMESISYGVAIEADGTVAPAGKEREVE